MEMNITFPGGKRVNAEVSGRVIETDQSKLSGGDGSAPEPYTLFLASLGTCAGIYVLGFCQARGISTEGMRLTQSMDFDGQTHRLARVGIDVHLPEGFPEKYLSSVRRAVDLCAVKKALFDPPEFEVRTLVGGSS